MLRCTIFYSFFMTPKLRPRLPCLQHSQLPSLAMVLLVSSGHSLCIQVRWFTGWCVPLSPVPLTRPPHPSRTQSQAESAHCVHFSRYSLQVYSLAPGTDSHMSTRVALQHCCESQKSSTLLDCIRRYVYIRNYSSIYLSPPQWRQHLLPGFATCTPQSAGHIH